MYATFWDNSVGDIDVSVQQAW